MVNYLLQGLLFGLAYVAPIGTQNLYVINSATNQNRLKVYQVALITVFFDITLAISCFLGVGIIIDRFLILKAVILFLGAVIVTYIGVSLIQTRAKKVDENQGQLSFLNIIASCFAVTWLNPQAIIDGSLLLGGFRASMPADMSYYFIFGVCIASFTWFNTLATVVLHYRNKFNKAIRVINIICGMILIVYGLKLGYSFLLMIK